MAIDTKLGIYHPLSYLSDFWVLRKNLYELNSTSIHELVHGKNVTQNETSTEE